MSRQITFAEVPNEISLSYLISGCRMRCRGCHSADAWSPHAGEELSSAQLVSDIERYKHFITCVLFLGGEWHAEQLIEHLETVRALGFKTCLYTGAEDVPSDVKRHLSYLKTGPYVASHGGLESPHTQQKFYDLETGECLNHLFQKTKGALHDSTQ